MCIVIDDAIGDAIIPVMIRVMVPASDRAMDAKLVAPHAHLRFPFQEAVFARDNHSGN
jgi:hypothetical protein